MMKVLWRSPGRLKFLLLGLGVLAWLGCFNASLWANPTPAGLVSLQSITQAGVWPTNPSGAATQTGGLFNVTVNQPASPLTTPTLLDTAWKYNGTRFNWAVDAGETEPQQRTLSVWCIELRETVTTGIHGFYPHTGDGSFVGLPIDNGGASPATHMDVTMERKIRNLFAMHFTQDIDSDPLNPGGENGENARAMQVAIWKILFPTANISSFVAAGDPALTKGLAWAAAADANGPYALGLFILDSQNDSDNRQGQIGIFVDDDGTINVIPCPPALAMALIGVATLGGYRLRRRFQSA